MQMMQTNKSIVAVACLLGCWFSGCASLQTPSASDAAFSAHGAHGAGGPRDFLSLQNVQPGMSPQEVLAVLGQEVTIGYIQSDQTTNAFLPITLPQPYRTEVLTLDGTTYEIFYYFTRVRKADGVISEEELTPLIFAQGRLTAKGWDDVFTLKNKTP